MIRRLFDALRTGGMSERRPRDISDSLALTIAGQVAVGLTRVEHEDPDMVTRLEHDRARDVLTTIALMLQNATDNEHVHETLGMVAYMTSRSQPGGGVIISFTPPREPGSE